MSQARLPDFVVPGTQKGGTTSLHQLLRRHPQVYLPSSKEVHYFSLHADQPVTWYAAHYAQAKPQQRCGDITPYYLFHPWVPQRLAALQPRVKLVVLLRDPVERCLSQYFHSRRLGFEPLELPEAIAAEAQRLEGAEAVLQAPGARHRAHQENSYLARSRYPQQLERYEQQFSRDQLLLLRSEDLFADPEPMWQRLQAWLGLNPITLPGALPRANAGKGEAAQVPERWRGLVREQLEPTYRQLEQHWGLRW